MRASYRSDDVMGLSNVGGPVPECLIQGVLKCTAAGVHADNTGSHELHAEDIKRLPLHVFGSHVHVTFKSEPCSYRCGCHAVLPGAGFGNNTWLAHAPGQEDLPHGVVDFMGAGMVEVFPL